MDNCNTKYDFWILWDALDRGVIRKRLPVFFRFYNYRNKNTTCLKYFNPSMFIYLSKPPCLDSGSIFKPFLRVYCKLMHMYQISYHISVCNCVINLAYSSICRSIQRSWTVFAFTYQWQQGLYCMVHWVNSIEQRLTFI